jgi:hypothetical protein
MSFLNFLVSSRGLANRRNETGRPSNQPSHEAGDLDFNNRSNVHAVGQNVHSINGPFMKE